MQSSSRQQCAAQYARSCSATLTLPYSAADGPRTDLAPPRLLLSQLYGCVSSIISGLQLNVLVMQSGAYGDDKLKVKLKRPAAIKEAACFMPAAGASMPSNQQNEGSWPAQGAAESSTPLVSLLLPSGSSCTAHVTNTLVVLLYSHCSYLGKPTTCQGYKHDLSNNSVQNQAIHTHSECPS